MPFQQAQHNDLIGFQTSPQFDLRNLFQHLQNHQKTLFLDIGHLAQHSNIIVVEILGFK